MTRKEYITKQLAAKGLKNTAANRKRLGAEYDKKYGSTQSGDGSTQSGDGSTKSGDWRERFKLEFPQFYDLVDGADGEAKARQEFGDDLIDLFLDYAKNPNNYDLTSEAGKKVWNSKVQATNLYTKVSVSRREWTLTPEANKKEQIEAKKVELLQEYGDLELDDRQLVDIATYSLSNKASKAQTKYYIFSIIAERTAAKGAPVALGETEDAIALRNNLKRFNYAPPGIEEQIKAALTGKSYLGTTYTPELLIKKAKDNAKIMMPHFAQQFDQGYTLDDVFEPYRDIAARTLEINPLDITYNDPKFMAALNKKTDGTSLSASEWEYMLKKDSKYKWSDTKQAKQAASQMINLLEQALGQYI